MTINLNVNDTIFRYPEPGDTNWGDAATGWASAVTTGMLQKSGGSFILTSEVDFGTLFGIMSLYYKARTPSPATVGTLRLGNLNTVSWRNTADDGNLSLGINASDQLIFNGTPVQPAFTIADTATIDLDITSDVLTANIKSDSITNAMINSAAGIAQSKMAALTASRAMVTDGSGFASAATTTATELGYVNGVTSSIQTQLDGKEPSFSVLPTSKGGTGQNSTAVFPVSGTVVTEAGVQALTNKDYNGGTASNTNRFTIPQAAKTVLDGLTRKKGTLVYASDLETAYIDNGSVLEEIGSGGGGGINYFESSGVDFDFEDQLTTGWATYQNAAQATPVTGAGGTPNVTFTNSGVAPQRGLFSAILTKGAVNYQGQGVAAVVDIPIADRGKPLSFSFDTLTSTNFVNGDAVVFAYDVTNAVLLPGSFAISQGQSTTRGWFLSSTSTAQIRFIIHVATTNATAYTVKVDEFQFGVQAYLAGPSMQDWTAYTPTTAGFGTLAVQSFWYRIIGDSLFIRGNFTCGTTNATLASISLPFTIASTKCPSSAFIAGRATRNNNTSNNVKEFSVIVDTATSTSNLYFGIPEYATAFSPISGRQGSQLFGNGEVVQMEAGPFPIVGYSSNQIVANRAVEEYAYNTNITNTATDTTSFGNGIVGIGISTNWATGTEYIRRVRFQTPIQSTDYIELLVNNSSVSLAKTDISKTIGAYQANTASFQYGARFVQVNNTDIDVYFSNGGARPASNYGGAVGTAWSAFSGLNWVAKKTATGGVAGLPLGARNVIGDTTGTTIPAGLIGESGESTGSATSMTTSTFMDGGNAGLTLTAGVYDLQAVGNFIPTSATITQIILGIGTASGTGTTGLDDDRNTTILNPDVTSSSVQVIQNSPLFRVVVPAGTTATYYPKLRATFSAGSITGKGTLRYRRAG